MKQRNRSAALGAFPRWQTSVAPLPAHCTRGKAPPQRGGAFRGLTVRLPQAGQWADQPPDGTFISSCVTFRCHDMMSSLVLPDSPWGSSIEMAT